MPNPRPRSCLMLAAPLLMAGCLSPDAAAPVADSALRHARAAQAAHAQDVSALRAATVALLEVRRRRLLTDLHLEFVSRWTDPDGRADPDAFDRALADPGEDAALVADVRFGLLTRANAQTLIADFAAAESLSSAADLQRAMLAGLSPVSRHDADARSLLAALDERASRSAALHAELLADAGALAAFTDQRPALDEASRAAASELWTLAVAGALHDPAQRAAAQRLLEQLLALGER
ncbi:MAG: hypothetical protein IBJ10_02305 [Phycisphaerales bacterium]|nr:hypothetical protein [Phycisphaerales bacterium]